jgi:hypothetical protein
MWTASVVRRHLFSPVNFCPRWNGTALERVIANAFILFSVCSPTFWNEYHPAVFQWVEMKHSFQKQTKNKRTISSTYVPPSVKGNKFSHCAKKCLDVWIADLCHPYTIEINKRKFVVVFSLLDLFSFQQFYSAFLFQRSSSSIECHPICQGAVG